VLTLHHSPFSRSVRVLWLLEELGLPYALVTLPPIRATTPFSQPTATGKVPTLEDGPVVMFESIAIMQYLLDRYGDGRLAPERDSADWPLFLQWLHFSEATTFPQIGSVARHSFALPEAERNAAALAENRALALRVLEPPEAALRGRDHLVGDAFTAADVAMGYTVGTASLLGLLGGFPALEAYLARLRARPAFARAVAR
jgi:glutathione S-transferase